MDFYFEEDSDETVGFNLGAGFSNDLNKFRIQPEKGLLINPGESGAYWTFGIGGSFYINQNE